MVFSSIEFLCFFLPLLLVVYFVVPKRFRGVRNMILLLFSLFFYAFGGPKFLLLMLISVGIDYFCGLFACPAFDRRIRKCAVIVAVSAGIGLLCYYKYLGFFVESINAFGFGLPVPQITLPIGISFYTFQGLSYVIDVYREDARVQRNPLRLALYIAFFPQLVAGPIVRYTTVEREIGNRQESSDEFYHGTVRFLLGFSKKMLLANPMGEIADGIFSLSSSSLSMSLAWLGAVAYTFQIYFDFSAYSDMAIGLGRMFGFHFLENFKYPYISKSITEFWRRWHISLSTWFRDYVYIPLGGNRKGRGKHIRNIAVVWFLTGMWHGASWNFILWGLWFCILLLGEKYLWGNVMKKLPNWLQHLYAMVLVIISWVLFRCETLPQVVTYVSAMFGLGTGGFWNNQTLYYLVEYRLELVVACIAAMPVKNIIKYALMRRRRQDWCKLCLNWGPTVVSLTFFLLAYLQLAAGSFNPFIYFRF